MVLLFMGHGNVMSVYRNGLCALASILVIGMIATVIVCNAVAALARGTRLGPVLMRHRGIDLMYPALRVSTHPCRASGAAARGNTRGEL